MRLPIILALIVVITLPADIRGLTNDVVANVQVATATVGKLFGRNGQPREAKVAMLVDKGEVGATTRH